MYDHLLVPYDGSASGRAVLGPTKDLAWRCGARTVIITNSSASEKASRRALKSRAQSLSGDDTDFWIDHDRSLGDAVLAAVEHRSNPLICLAVAPRGGLLARRALLDYVSARLLVEADVPAMVVGPKSDTSTGLPMNEVVVSLDGSAESEQALPLAAQWATELRTSLTVIGVSRTPTDEARSERRYLQDRLAHVPSVPGSSRAHLIEGDDPGSAITRYLADRPGAIMVMSTHGRSGVDDSPLGSVAQSVLLKSPRPVVFRRPAVAPAADDRPEPPRREVWLNLPD